ncbi:hypothetical protein CCM_04758 [Cordyceps militaris CM01]|uniref:Uncharacterized protein n=1 Tax=Cordyceps militaris (strain CM01) TaxID=983644 RepID=G3JED3_CORMM|nr:uncharacterized protein CCM_04758 [Cordyceps militaris CM01]EGX93384.1 hypothetical protein CCM_04758 [Cordyceps militaris CM01]
MTGMADISSLTLKVVFAIYVDSYCFVFATAMLQHAFGVNRNLDFIYLFLVEKAHVIRASTKLRLQSKLYIFNSFGMLGVYTVVVILNFIFRIARMENGQCIIGMQSISMIPLISFDAVVNVYLTILFLIPLKILFSAIVIQWVTSKDNAGTSISSSLRVYNGNGNGNCSPYGQHVKAPHDRRRLSRSFSPCLLDAASSSPTTPSEYPLVTTTRCCSQAVEYDAESYDSASMSAAKILAAEQKRPAVIVTTTIERDTAPIETLDSPLKQTTSHDLLGGRAHRHSHMDTSAVTTSDVLRRVSTGAGPWETVYTEHLMHGRTSSGARV